MGGFPDMEIFVPFPEGILDHSMAEAVQTAAELYSERVAIQTGGRAITFRELDQITNRLASRILECTSLEEENVTVLAQQGLPQLISILSILKAGKIYSVMDQSSSADRLAEMITDFGSRLTITDSFNATLAAQTSGSSAIIIDLDKLDPSDNAILIRRPFDHPAGVYYTSGSTGQPKGVVYDQRGLLHYSITANHCYRMTKHDRQPLPFSCSFAWSAPIVFSTLLCGGTLFPLNLREMNMQEFAAAVDHNRFTILQLTPSFLRPFMASLDASHRHYPELRLIVTGGEALQGHDVQLWQRLFAADSKLGYILASTEASYITFHTYGTTDQIPPGKLPVGYVVPGKKVIIVNDGHQSVPDGETGEIVVHHEYGGRGYWNKPDLSKAVVQPDPLDPRKRFFYSKDLGRFLPNGQVEHFGRRDNLVKIRGYRVELQDIEDTLHSLF